MPEINLIKFPLYRNAAARRCAEQASQNGNFQENFKKVQGTMDEDEALAKAIYESMLENEQRVTVGNASGSSSSDRNKNCAIS